MRAMNIRVYSGQAGWAQMKASFRANWKHYIQESLGLAIFMFSACFFSVLLESKNGSWHRAIPEAGLRVLISGILMGATALFIFYSPFTSPSGSHINPAVTATFLRLGRICPWDAVFYTLFQCLGGILAVYLMIILLGHSLTDLPVQYAVTIPGKYGQVPAAILEFVIAFFTMSMVLFTTEHAQWKKYTRLLAASLVCTYVIVAGPVSGFGMNPARSLASALPAHQWTAFWIYAVIPFAGMLTASEYFLWVKKGRILKSGGAMMNHLH